MISETALMAFIALLGTMATMFFQMKTRRDQLQYDTKFAVLESKQKLCEESDAAKNVRIASLEAHIVTLTATDVRDKMELTKKIEAVAEAKNGK